MVATLTGVASNEIVAHGLTALRNLDHRGAVGGEPDTGDGAGMLLQVPDRFLREIAQDEGIELPEAGTYAVGMAFLPIDADEAAESKATIESLAGEEGLTVLGWREVPVNPDILGSMSRGAMPSFELVFVTATGEPRSGIELDRLAFCLRKRAEHEAGVYFPSLSARTLVYKGMLTTKQLDAFFPDLRDERMESALCIVHSRFSTNTFPSWPLAHPFRFIAHNGEINTARGNRNWMRAREATLESDLIPGDLKRLFPICDPEGSDTASFDEVLELLHLGGRDLPHAVMMMIPEAWENDEVMDPARRAFYEFHSSLMEPWDGPACVAFTDGNQIGAVLDRNGLRPGSLLDHRGRSGRAGVRGRRPRHRPEDHHPQGPARAGQDVPARPVRAPGHRGHRDQGHAGGRAPVRRVAVLRPGAVRRPARPRAHRAHARVGHPPPAGVRLHRGGAAHPGGTDRPHRRRGDRLHGHRHPDRRAVGPAAAAVRLLQPAVRAGHQPAARRHPRGGRHLARRHHGSGDQPADAQPGVVPDAAAAVPGHRQRRARQDPAHEPRRRHARVRGPRRARPLRRPRRGSGPQGEARRDLRRRVERGRRRRSHRRALGPSLRRRPRAHPVAAAHRRGAPPHGAREAALAGRPAGRDRRRPRGAPRRPADRLRRHRGQPVPRAGVGRGPRPRGQLRAGHGAGPGAAQPRVRPRQGRAEGHEQDGRLHGGVLHRRPDLRGGRPVPGTRRRLLHRHVQQARRRRARRHRPGGRVAPRQGVPHARHRRRASPPRGRRRVPVAS